MMSPTREQLIELLLVERLSVVEAARRLGVHRNTVHRAVKAYEINTKEWWKHQRIHCKDCGAEIDPEVKLGERARKRLIGREEPLCDTCKAERRKVYNREKQREWRARNRSKYNAYMKRWREEHPEEWQAIRDRCYKKD